MIVLGITGGIGSGKGLATDFFRSRGVAIVDADEIAREVVSPGSPVLADIVSAFGEEVLRGDGSLNRGRLADLVFGDSRAVATLNTITHPAILQEVDCRLERLRAEGTALACVVAPLLVEAGRRTAVDRLIVMWAEEEARICRVMRRDGVSREEVKRRMAAQMAPEEQRRHADWVVDTTPGEEAAREQLEAIWRELVG
jgi:dephospho-CoA kinase